MSLTGPFVLHFDCCCCIIWYQEQHCKAKSQARGETSQSFHINSPQGSHGVEIWTSANRHTLFSAAPCLSALNNPGSSLQKCLTHFTRSWAFHQRSADLQWPAPFDTCCLVALVKQLVTIWWQLNRGVLPTSTCVEVEVEEEWEGGVWRRSQKNLVACEDKYGSRIQSSHLCYWPLPARLRQWHQKVTKGPIEGI